MVLGHKSAMTAARSAQWIEQYKDPTGVGAASDAKVGDDRRKNCSMIEQYKDPTGVGAASDANVRDDAATAQ
jgi:hypothetical protein